MQIVRSDALLQNAVAKRSLRPTAVRRSASRAVIWLILMVGAFITLMPFLWLLRTSLMTPQQIFRYPPELIPNPVRWQNYPEALRAIPFWRYIANTLIITLTNVLAVLLTSSLCAYGFARLRFPGRDVLFMLLLSTLMLPFAVTLIPSYIMFRYLGWLNTWLPLIVPNFFGGSAFYIFLLRQFFRTIPLELSDAARIDGASEFRIFWQIILPLSRPALAVVAIFTFLDNWNDFLRPLVYLSDHEKFTIALGLAQFRGLYATQWHYLMAASAVMTLPVVLLFFLAQRYFVRGIVLTGLRG
ncbi:MAG: carbohydrate ABC transporter permease [Thermorudis peleae]|nr:carbohydrate ABC transporter permease [Thermorudis peleae]